MVRKSVSKLGMNLETSLITQKLYKEFGLNLLLSISFLLLFLVKKIQSSLMMSL